MDLERLLSDESIQALRCEQHLTSAEGQDLPIFPPTYLAPKGSDKSVKSIYNLSPLPSGGQRVTIDSVGSQANRIEALFGREPYSSLIPDVRLSFPDGSEVPHYLAPHRAADASVRFSNIKADFDEAWGAHAKGDDEPMAKLSPLSLVFGAWDSRGKSRSKYPRAVSSRIDADGVSVQHRSSTLAPPFPFEQHGVEVKGGSEAKASEGLVHHPASGVLGGVLGGDPVRRAALVLQPIRDLRASSPEKTARLSKYILGLALVGITSPAATGFLRTGCVLVGRGPGSFEFVRLDGTTEEVALSHGDALKFATAAAREFGVGPKRSGKIDPKIKLKKANEEEDAASAAEGGEGA